MLSWQRFHPQRRGCVFDHFTRRLAVNMKFPAKAYAVLLVIVAAVAVVGKAVLIVNYCAGKM